MKKERSENHHFPHEKLLWHIFYITVYLNRRLMLVLILSILQQILSAIQIGFSLSNWMSFSQYVIMRLLICIWVVLEHFFTHTVHVYKYLCWSVSYAFTFECIHVHYHNELQKWCSGVSSNICSCRI